mmetsp:Transcript_26188/g.104748  ORF Transcript_26188/g.104748 Transcript_26188/m.104748 type:complete len:277 (+) Transcript_26188:969-1799(+)
MAQLTEARLGRIAPVSSKSSRCGTGALGSLTTRGGGDATPFRLRRELPIPSGSSSLSAPATAASSSSSTGSSNGRGGKKVALHKFERFLRPADYLVATFYGPVTFAPAPVFLFDDAAPPPPPSDDDVAASMTATAPKVDSHLIATGALRDVDPTHRVVLKRVVLTGIPARSHKRKAVVKHMFHDPADVRYFRPAQLSTKRGLTANILEPLGTHGNFKVALNKPMAQSDTFLLTLYKRVYPKFPRSAPPSEALAHDDGPPRCADDDGDGAPANVVVV